MCIHACMCAHGVSMCMHAVHLAWNCACLLLSVSVGTRTQIYTLRIWALELCTGTSAGIFFRLQPSHKFTASILMTSVSYATEARLKASGLTYDQLLDKDKKLGQHETPYGPLVKSFEVEEEPEVGASAAAKATYAGIDYICPMALLWQLCSPSTTRKSLCASKATILSAPLGHAFDTSILPLEPPVKAFPSSKSDQ